MSEAVADRTVPRGAILGAAALIIFAMVVASAGRLTGIGAVRADYAKSVQTTSFRFEDRPDGGISVIAPETGAVVGVVPAGTDGFVRTVLRSLAFDRKRHHAGSEPAFLITKWADGHSTLDDPVTGRRVDLAAFGAANMQTFANLLTMRGGQS
jgi:putative photosynthetic complex assembly protein